MGDVLNHGLCHTIFRSLCCRHIVNLNKYLSGVSKESCGKKDDKEIINDLGKGDGIEKV